MLTYLKGHIKPLVEYLEIKKLLSRNSIGLHLQHIQQCLKGIKILTILHVCYEAIWNKEYFWWHKNCNTFLSKVNVMSPLLRAKTVAISIIYFHYLKFNNLRLIIISLQLIINFLDHLVKNLIWKKLSCTSKSIVQLKLHVYF